MKTEQEQQKKHAVRIRKATECETEILGSEWSKETGKKEAETRQYTERKRTAITGANDRMENEDRTKKKCNGITKWAAIVAVSVFEN